MSFYTLRWTGAGLSLIDQRQLPTTESYVELTTCEGVAQAIETMVVRGAPAIGIAAAFGVAIAERNGDNLEEADTRLRGTRPTAVNLFWALDRMKEMWSSGAGFETLLAEAQSIYDEDAAASRAMGEIGAALVPDGATILTHCNAGALATAEYGTALAVIRAAHAQGKTIKVFADETRPVLQGARLTAWELQRDGIDVTVIADGAAAHFILGGAIDLAVTGADRVAANGDVANKIGTAGVAALMHLAGKPFYVAAPWSTIDLQLSSGADIVIEERAAREVTHVGDVQIVPDGVTVRNPAFDITPAKWVNNLFTERGATGPDIAQGLINQDRLVIPA